MKTLFPKLWVKNALLAFLFLLSVSATIILINLFESSYDKENFFYKSYEKKSSLNDNHIPAETGVSSENILPPGCDYSKSAIDLTKNYDWCIVGAGLSGTVFAERASELDESVLVVDYSQVGLDIHRIILMS